MKVWKKNLVAAAVLLTVCGGIYGNWLYSQDQAVSDLTETLDESKIMSADKLVIADGEGALVNESPDTMTDYFAAFRLSRLLTR